jgi:hypothetical protein
MASVPAGLIGGIYTVDFARALNGAAPADRVYAATASGQAGFMALEAPRQVAARGWALAALAGVPIANLLTPLAHGATMAPTGSAGYFVICAAPPGPAVTANPLPWTEPELLNDLLKPVAAALAEMQKRGVTHRAVCPANLFQSARHRPVTLGAAWAAPPGSYQPTWCEPPYVAGCPPWGRGDGSVADDVYALGAVMLALCLGRNPLEGLTDDEVLRRKLDIGSFAALTEGHRLPIGVTELVRGMLADDPAHRPSPTLLTNPLAARARRIATSPVRRVTRSIVIGKYSAHTARSLAYALARAPAQGVTALRTGFVDRWLRHSLEDASLAGRVDGVVRKREAAGRDRSGQADATLIAKVVAVLDPLAPLVWRNLILWPDALGFALHHMLHHAPDQVGVLLELLSGTLIEQWQQRRERSGNADVERDLSLRRRESAWRLCYRLNPLVPCASPLLAEAWVIRPTELLPAIEASAARRGLDGTLPLDTHIADFLVVRGDDQTPISLGLDAATSPTDAALIQTRVLGRLQERLHPNPLPALGTWASTALQPLIQTYQSRSRRVRIAARLAELAAAGQLAAIAALFEAKGEHETDQDEQLEATRRLAVIEWQLTALDASGPNQGEQARRLAHDVTSGLAALAFIAGVAGAVLF